VVDELQHHYVLGRLSQDELDERVSRALAARTFGDLDAELHGLPPASASELPPSGAAPESDVDEPAKTAAAPWGDGSFRAHATSYLLVMALLVAIWLLTSPGGYFWPVWPMLGWGFGLAAHGLASRSSTRASRRALRHERRRSRDSHDR
jgi:hypothetical protein